MKKINVRQVMKRAVELAKAMIGDWAARMALALRQAWKEAKSVVSNELGCVRIGENETAIKIGQQNVTFEYKNQTFTLDVEVKVLEKKKEIVVEISGKRINHSKDMEQQVERTANIPVEKARVENGHLIMSKEVAKKELPADGRVLAGVEVFGKNKAN
jgi:hypothetical protein